MGSAVTSATPTLTVGNATGAPGLRYRFEVAADAAFTATVASIDDVPEGSAGTTSWTVGSALGPGATYHWRARASAGGSSGPFSAPASFEIVGGFLTPSPAGLLYVFDPLTGGGSVGEAGGGGEFKPDGWMATNALSYIRYEIPPTPNGFVEFDVTNLRNPNPHSDKRALMIMWDPSRGEYTANPFRVTLSKYDTNIVDRWHMRLRFISNGEETNTGINFYRWDPSRLYHFRMEWGAFPEIVSSQRVQVLMDGDVILVRNYDRLYLPETHWVELGMAPRAESLEQAIYSNVRIGIRQP
ncbi:MAG TPA: hypothetical protein VJ921_00440 [Vicinamibacteria bacterium]|nr:hypothetical protein [Vicinamibacteria bacterium]